MSLTFRRSTRSRVAARRGAGVIIIAALLLPAALFALALTNDYGRVVLAIRKCSDVADAVVMAAASVRTDNGELYPPNKHESWDADSSPYWLETYRLAARHGMVNPDLCAEPRAVYLPDPADGRVTRVRVTLVWKVDSLPFVSFFTEDGSMQGTVTRNARICIAETDSRPCAYPV